MSSSFHPINPNVRDKIISGLRSKFKSSEDRFRSSDFFNFQINTKIGQPSFSDPDLPMIHISLGPEQVDQYLNNNLFKDFRECQLLISIYANGLTRGEDFIKFKKSNIKEGVAHIENVSRLIGTLILEYEDDGQPKEVVWGQFAGRNLNIAETSDPKIISSTMTYNLRYNLNLNHPKYFD